MLVLLFFLLLSVDVLIRKDSIYLFLQIEGKSNADHITGSEADYERGDMWRYGQCPVEGISTELSCLGQHYEALETDETHDKAEIAIRNI